MRSMEGQQGEPGSPSALPAGRHQVWKECTGGNPTLLQEEGKSTELMRQRKGRKDTKKMVGEASQKCEKISLCILKCTGTLLITKSWK